MTHDDWQVERMQPPEMPPCRNCGHEEHQALWCDCGCEGYVPADAENLRQDEFTEEL